MNNCIVVIPTYNEKENISSIVKAVFELALPLDVLVVDDNSPDGTADIVKNLQLEFKQLPKALGRELHLLQRQEKSGLGTAYIAGFKYALSLNYKYIFEMDADFSHNPDDLIKLYQACENEGYDVAIGSRYVSGVNVVNWPIGRVLMSYFASVYVRFITGLPVQDTTAGFICYRDTVLRNIDLDNIRFIGYAFQIEMKFLSWKYGFKLKEVPIIFTDRTQGTSKMSKNIFKEAILGVIQIKMRSFFQKYHRQQ
ncbi:MAG: polyprenol monophosphomannose synthase [Cyclobacteriaceae bacterium]